MSFPADLISPAVLRVRGLAFNYPQRPVFAGWSHDFKAGLTWLRGSNGCGKSTLLKLLAGALPPLTGEIDVQGLCFEKQPLAYRREVFWCGPGPVVFDHLSPAEFFGFMRTLYPGVDNQALAWHVQGFGLDTLMALPLSTLSTGTQRKVWLAIALAAGTRVTLLDEPLNALDANSLAHLRATFLACAQDASRAWIVTSHEELGVAAPLSTVLDMRPLA